MRAVMGSRILWLAVVLGPAFGAGCTGGADDDAAPNDGDHEGAFDDDGSFDGFDACVGTRTEDERFDRAMAALRNEVAEWFVPGGAMAVVWGGDVRHVGVTGSRRGTCTPVTENTSFRAGVLTEMITAAAILRSPPGAAIDLDAKVTDLVPELAIEGGGQDAIRIRHLLTHGSGYGGDLRLGEQCPTLLDFLEPGEQAPAFADPGVIHQVNVANYALAGLALERATGWPFEYAVWRRILDPLKMTHSSFRPATAVRHEAADGHGLGGVPVGIDALDCGAEWPGRGLTTTIGDLADFAAMLQRGGDELLAPEDVAALMGADDARNFYPGRATGFGVERIDARGGTPELIVRQGAVDGFAQALVMVPDYDLAVVVLMNAEWGRPAKVAYETVRVFLGIEPEPPFEANPASWAGLEGTYRTILSITPPPQPDPRAALPVRSRVLAVSRVMDTLIGQLDHHAIFVLHPVADEDVFWATVKGNVHRLRFWRDATDSARFVSEADAEAGPPFDRIVRR